MEKNTKTCYSNFPLAPTSANADIYLFLENENAESPEALTSVELDKNKYISAWKRKLIEKGAIIMKILSINTSSNICSVALLEDTTLIKKLTINDANTHSVKLMPLINELFNSTNLSLQDIDLFACDKGPGSFTGIRIGISTIKAFCDVTNKPSIGISSLTSLAYLSNHEGLICSLIDAKNDNVYYGLFEHKNGTYTQIGELLADNIHDITKILKLCNKPVFFVGNGSSIYKDMLESNLKENAIIQDNTKYCNLSAYHTGLAAFNTFNQNENPPLSPLYLKKSNAERELEEKK